MSSLDTTERSLCTCPVCDAVACMRRAIDDRWDVFLCSQCRLEFCHPMPTPEELDAFYRDYSDPRAAGDIVQANAERNVRTLQEWGLNAESRLLDYGSGLGSFSEVLHSDHWFSYDRYTQDNDESLLAHPGVYDWVTLWGVLEHLVDPVGLLRRLAGLLRSRGHIALTTVSTELAIPCQYKPPEHTTYWTRPAIDRAFAAAGLQTRDYRPYEMLQRADVYLDAVLRTVPDHLRPNISHQLPAVVEVPTNEVFVVGCKGG